MNKLLIIFLILSNSKLNSSVVLIEESLLNKNVDNIFGSNKTSLNRRNGPLTGQMVTRAYSEGRFCVGSDFKVHSISLARSYFEKLGGDIDLFNQGLCILKNQKGKTHESALGDWNIDPCIMNLKDNYNVIEKQVKFAKFYRVNVCTGSVVYSASALGKGGVCDDGQICEDRKNKTPGGVSILGHGYERRNKKGKLLKKWYPGLKLFPIPENAPNKLTFTRGVVTHRAKEPSGEDYCNNSIRRMGNFTEADPEYEHHDEEPECTDYSEGCTSLGDNMWKYYIPLLDQKPKEDKPGVGELHFNFTKYHKNYSKEQDGDYCELFI